MSSAGYVLLAVFLLCFVYLVPALVRRRQVVLDSRIDDRYSSNLRVVTTAGRATRPDAARTSTRTSPSAAALHTRREITAVPARGGPTVNRPAGMTERLAVAEARRAAAMRAAAAAARAERVAAARRRLVLTIAILVTMAVSWAAVVVADFSYLLALVPTVLLVGVLVLGRRAAAAAARADARAVAAGRLPARGRAARGAAPAHSPAQMRARLRTDGPWADSAPTTASRAPGGDVAARGERPSGLTVGWDTDAPATGGSSTDRTDDDTASVAADPGHGTGDRDTAAPEEDATAARGGWTPVPVPVPTYTLKPMAPRRQQEPWEPAAAAPVDEGTVAPSDDGVRVAARAGAITRDADAQEAGARGTPGAGIDVSAVLARRRAAGQ